MLRLDGKLARIRSGAYARNNFVLAAALDSENGPGIQGAGPARSGGLHLFGGGRKAEKSYSYGSGHAPKSHYSSKSFSKGHSSGGGHSGGHHGGGHHH